MIKIIDLLNESKKTEETGLSILNKNNVENAEMVIKQFTNGDKSNNQKNIPFMSLMYLKTKNIDSILSVFNEYNELESLKRIKPLQFSKGSLFVGDKKIDNIIEFGELVHSIQSKFKSNNTGVSYSKSDSDDVVPMDEPMWSGNGFDIYDGNDVDKCIKYRNGGLTNKSYTFCIGAYGASNMFQSYRDNYGSTFYFIVDKNRIITNEDGSVNLDDPLHIVVYDVQQNDNVILTDGDNNTGNISEFGRDEKAYINYLKSHNVPVDILVNKPKTQQEIEDDKIIGKQNTNLQWFINLPMDYKSRYIGRGHTLSDQQFDYLIGD